MSLLQKPNLIGLLFAAFLTIVTASICEGQDTGKYLPSGGYHPLYRADMPAGAVGQGRLLRRGPVANYFQPVVFKGPEGTHFALPQGQAMGPGQSDLMAGLLIGNVYRYRVTRIPDAPGVELFPTVELIDRTYPPQGLANKFPIPITLDERDFEAALSGKMVTRVVYLEDPQTALPLNQEHNETTVLEVGEKDDALRIADKFGRPVAIVRMGTVAPPRQPELMHQFYFGFPVWNPIYLPETPQQ